MSLTFLRDDPACQFVCFIDLTGVDYPEREKRFEVIYHLLSPKLNRRVRVKIATDEDDAGAVERRRSLSRCRLVRARGL